MDNEVKIEVKGSKVTIEFDTQGEGIPSKTGKMALLASTHGFRTVTVGKRNIRIALNAGVSA